MIHPQIAAGRRSKGTMDSNSSEGGDGATETEWTGSIADIIRRATAVHGPIDSTNMSWSYVSSDWDATNWAGRTWVGTLRDGQLNFVSVPKKATPERIIASEETFVPVTGNEFFFAKATPPTAPRTHSLQESSHHNKKRSASDTNVNSDDSNTDEKEPAANINSNDSVTDEKEPAARGKKKSC
jgi:hypothetical protein